MKERRMERIFLLMVAVVFMLTGIAFSEEEAFPVLSGIESFTVSGALEAEAGFVKDYDDVNTSDIALATMEIGVDAQMKTWVSGHLLLLWEEDDTEPVDLDEAFITIENADVAPFFVSVGKLYVPFGVYESNMISDPLTLEIGETRESAIVVGGSYQWFYGSVYVFNGDVDEVSNDEDDAAETYGVNAGILFEKEGFSVDAGAGYISNLLEADGLQGYIEEEGLTLKDYCAGVNAHVMVTAGGVSVIAEYIQTLDDPEFFADDGSNVKQEDISAFHFEGAYTFNVMEKETTVAATYQITDNLAELFPEERFGVSAGTALVENLTLSAEYLHDTDYEEKDGGSGETQDSFTLQLALEF